MDAAELIDPTGTEKMRANYSRRLDMAWRQFGVMVRRLVVDQDALLLSTDMLTTATILSRQGKDAGAMLEGFDAAIAMLAKRIIRLPQQADAIRFVGRAYSKGSRFALSQAGAGKKTSQRAVYTREMAVQKAGLELSGIAAAVCQQMSRAAARAIGSNDPAPVLMTTLQGVIEKVGVSRSRLMAEDVIISTFTNASLDTYEALGIGLLGIQSEEIEPKIIADAKAKAKRKATRKRGAGSKSSRKQAPSRSTIYRIRKQELELAKSLGSKVYVRTAGDNRVCPICEEISEGGPYTINKARSLIPAHPRCRCVFIPAKDKRFKRDSITLGAGILSVRDERGEWKEIAEVSSFVMRPIDRDFNENEVTRVGKGFSEGGQFSTSPYGRTLSRDELAKLEPRWEVYTDRKTRERRKQAVRNWMTGGYEDINEALRAGDWQTGPQQRDIRSLRDVFEKAGHPLSDDIRVYRGVSTKHGFDKVMPGDEISDQGFNSTATDKSFAKEFVRDMPDRALVQITIPRGTRVISPRISGDREELFEDNESELLLPMGTRYRVTKRRGGVIFAEVMP